MIENSFDELTEMGLSIVTDSYYIEAMSALDIRSSSLNRSGKTDCFEEKQQHIYILDFSNNNAHF